MGWGYGPPMWGFWPMFPLMGFAFVIVMVVVVFLLLRGKGTMCGFGQRSEMEDLRNEVRALRREIEGLKKQA
jgi:uncharacterized membrane protein